MHDCKCILVTSGIIQPRTSEPVLSKRLKLCREVLAVAIAVADAALPAGA